MTPSDYDVYIRKFLNKPGYHGIGMILATFEGEYGCGSLQINDCTRSVTLDVNASTVRHKKNTLHKLDTLLDTLGKLREAVAEHKP